MWLQLAAGRPEESSGGVLGPASASRAQCQGYLSTAQELHFPAGSVPDVRSFLSCECSTRSLGTGTAHQSWLVQVHPQHCLLVVALQPTLIV